jgi:hypothetical protein
VIDPSFTTGEPDVVSSVSVGRALLGGGAAAVTVQRADAAARTDGVGLGERVTFVVAEVGCDVGLALVLRRADAGPVLASTQARKVVELGETDLGAIRRVRPTADDDVRIVVKAVARRGRSPGRNGRGDAPDKGRDTSHGQELPILSHVRPPLVRESGPVSGAE